MNEQRLRDRLRENDQRTEELRRELAALRASLERFVKDSDSVRRDYDTLVDATRIVTDERDELRRRVAELEATNKRLIDMHWGRRSERRVESPGQMEFRFADDPVEPLSAAEQEIITAQTQAEAASDEELLARLKAKKARRAKAKGREEFPEHLERRVRRIDLPEEQKQGLKYIGTKIFERLRFEKPHVYVEVLERLQYVIAGRPEQGVRSMPAPLSIVEGCKYDFSVIAAIVAMKFGFHMPTYRQQDWFGQCGWFPRRSTVNDLINYTVETVVPLYEEMWRRLLSQPILLGDDTTLCVLLRGKLDEKDLATLSTRSRYRKAMESPSKTGPPGSATSYAWVYGGLNGLAPYNVFHWSLTHQNSVIDGHLATYRGIFVGDASGANARLEQRSEGRIVHASCNVHARRGFVEAESNDPVLASQAESLYRQLYEIEERGVLLDADARRELRQREAVPIWNRMRRWLDSDPVSRALPQSAIGQAIGYLRNQWAALQRYLSDGRIPIDNNQSEQAIRPLTVGRGNWLFLGHPKAAPGRLQLFSVVSSAHRHHLVLDDYLEDVLRRLADAKQNHPTDLQPGSPYLAELLPDRWALSHPESVRTDRIEENETVFDAKRCRRARSRIQARASQSPPR